MKDPLAFKILFSFYKQEFFEEDSKIFKKIFESTAHFECQAKSELTKLLSFLLVKSCFVQLLFSV